MKAVLIMIALLASVASANAASIFTRIAADAQVGNGSTKISRYDTSLNRAELNSLGKSELEAAYWENCGPWKTITGRQDAIKELRKIEDMQESSDVASRLEALYRSEKIVAVAAAFSNNEVECSLSWFIFYGADGTAVKLLYNMGD